MIKVLGRNRIILLLVLLLINAVVAAAVYLYLAPETTQKEREARTLRGQVSTLGSDIARLEIEFDQLEMQQAAFEQLKEKGFFGRQGRREAELLFGKIQQKAGVVSAVANIRAGALERSEEAGKARHVLLTSPIEISLEALDDVDVYKYIYLVEKFFPGHVALQDIKLERRSEITGAVLRGIAGGGNPVLVEAKINMLWRTMIPESEVIGAEGGAP